MVYLKAYVVYVTLLKYYPPFTFSLKNGKGGGGGIW